MSGDEVEAVELRHHRFSLDQGVSDDRPHVSVPAAPATCTVAMQHPLSSAPFARIEASSQTPEAMEKNLLKVQGLTRVIANTMISIGIFNWTSLVRMAIVIWCNATM